MQLQRRLGQRPLRIICLEPRTCKPNAGISVVIQDTLHWACIKFEKHSCVSSRSCDSKAFDKFFSMRFFGDDKVDIND